MDRDLLDERQDVLFEKLVPSSGRASTVEGEHLRAINKIMYRYSNDGDYFNQDYGVETAGPAHAYLYKSKYIDVKYILDSAAASESSSYNDCLYEVLEIIVSYIENRNGDYRENSVDMLNCEPIFTNYKKDEYEF